MVNEASPIVPQPQALGGKGALWMVEAETPAPKDGGTLRLQIK
jgi:hypothetical protein